MRKHEGGLGAAHGDPLLRLPSSASWINSFAELYHYMSKYREGGRRKCGIMEPGTLEDRLQRGTVAAGVELEAEN